MYTTWSAVLYLTYPGTVLYIKNKYNEKILLLILDQDIVNNVIHVKVYKDSGHRYQGYLDQNWFNAQAGPVHNVGFVD